MKKSNRAVCQHILNGARMTKQKFWHLCIWISFGILAPLDSKDGKNYDFSWNREMLGPKLKNVNALSNGVKILAFGF